jgi:hypothetical protein
MAQSWADLVLDLESYYPKARGGVARDEDLRRQLVVWANNAMESIERQRRWSLSYGFTNFTTTPNVGIYPIPAGITTISWMYWLDTGSGTPIILREFSAMELRRAFGEGANSIAGRPANYAINGRNLQLFPMPDNTGPIAGNYQIFVEGYQGLLPIVETSGGVFINTAVLTVPSTGFLTSRGLATSGTTGLSVRGAGFSQFSDRVDTLLTNWSAFPSPTTVTMSSNAHTSGAGLQTFFNSVNWLIQDFPFLLEFAVLREIAAYLKDDYRTWEMRFAQEMDAMAAFDVDRTLPGEVLATAQTGQRQSQLRRLDAILGIEVRGGILP